MVVSLLLSSDKVEINTKNIEGRTPLSYAAANGYKAVVELLLKAGADVEAKTNYGWTPLWCATMNGHEAVVQQLLKCDAKTQ